MKNSSALDVLRSIKDLHMYIWYNVSELLPARSESDNTLSVTVLAIDSDGCPVLGYYDYQDQQWEQLFTFDVIHVNAWQYIYLPTNNTREDDTLPEGAYDL